MSERGEEITDETNSSVTGFSSVGDTVNVQYLYLNKNTTLTKKVHSLCLINEDSYVYSLI